MFDMDKELFFNKSVCKVRHKILYHLVGKLSGGPIFKLVKSYHKNVNLFKERFVQ